MNEVNSLITIIVPVYNLEKCLNSIINQTYKNLEIICIDDGSPDNSIEILNTFTKKDNRIKIIRQENQGLSGARNTGIKNATGKYIMFIDSDDWIEPDMVELMVVKMQKDDLDLVVCGNYNHFYNRIKKEELNKLVNKKMTDGLDYFKQNYKIGYRFGNCWNKIYKLDIIKEKKIIFPIGKLYEDLLFVFKYLIEVKKIGIEEKALYHYIILRENSITGKLDKKVLSDVLELSKELEIFLIKNKKNDFLNSNEFKEYMFSWISGAIIFKIPFIEKKYKKEKVNEIINELKNNKEYRDCCQYIIENSKNKKKKLFIKVLYFNNDLMKLLVKLQNKINILMKRGI